MSGTPQRTSNPAVAAFLQSTRWKLLLAADATTAVGGGIGYALTKSLLAFAPFAVVATFLAFTLYRLVTGAVPAAGGGDDSIVK